MGKIPKLVLEKHRVVQKNGVVAGTINSAAISARTENGGFSDNTPANKVVQPETDCVFRPFENRKPRQR